MKKKHILTIASMLVMAALASASCQKETNTKTSEAAPSEMASADGYGCALTFSPRTAALLQSGSVSVKATLINENGSEPKLKPTDTFDVAAWDVASDGSLTPAITPFETVKYITGTTTPINMWMTVDDSGNVIEHFWKSSVSRKLFYACSNVSVEHAAVEDADTDSPVMKVSYVAADQTDILMGYYLGDGKTEVETEGGTQTLMTGTASVEFKHPLAAVAFEMGTILAPADSFKIEGITLEGIYAEGTAEMDTDGVITWSGCSDGGSLSQSVAETPASGQVGETFLVIPQTFASDSSRVEISAKLGENPVKLYIKLNGDTWAAGKITKYTINYDAHKGIQLWEDGPYWASCNIGADYPEEYGWFFTWGNDEGFVPTELTPAPAGTSPYSYRCSWKSVKDGHILTDGFTEQYYMTTPGYTEVYNHDIDAAHDAATKILGAGWRMPTSDELSKLISADYTVCKEVNINGVHYGYMFSGKGDYANRSIFLPSAGYGGGDLYTQGDYGGHYWSTGYISSQMAYSLQWNRAPGYLVGIGVRSNVRSYARTIRPVENY